ncbi:LysM peptidoglycan-binding domain-containing protein [Spirosoma soli]|uniref:LysM peptidoglycan-binding domain-containing protein n=1 Tax=Spirosoma soli TaxID=1770529 RepID=A0ABW5M9F1_9BACT
MKKYPIIFASFLVGIISYVQVSQAYPVLSERLTAFDSVGVEKKDGKRFILHRVDEGQTLFAIARRYRRSVAEIKAANPDMNESVRYDQLVRIPIPDGALNRKEAKALDKAIRKEEKQQKREAKVDGKPASTDEKKTAKAEKNPEKDAKKNEDPARSGIHVVEPGQTLYSLAVRYGVPQSDLRKWNNLSSNNVLIGQALIVSEKAYQARVPSSPAPSVAIRTSDTPTRTETAKPAETRPAEPKPTTTRRTDPPAETKPERTTPVAENRRNEPTPAPSTKPAAEVEIESPRPGNDAPIPMRGRRISDSGVAEMIEGADGSGKYLALHRTAPIGTLVQVRNEFNNQSLWVKVIGRLPNTGVNDKILIKLSAQAFAKLSPEDKRFRAEVSYIVR